MVSIVLASAATALTAVTNLPTVTVESSRFEKNLLESAAHVELIDREEILSSGATSMAEMLEKRANLHLRKINSNPAMAQISMRGYGANSFGRVKVIVDGEVVSNPDMEPQNLMCVPLAGVDKVEVVRGPCTVLYGGDASAGVIDIVSSAPLAEGEELFTGEVRGGSEETFGVYLGVKGTTEESLSYYGNSDFLRSDGWRDNSGYEIWTANGGLKQDFKNGASLKIRAGWADGTYGLPEGIFSGKATYGKDYGSWKDDPRASSGRIRARNRVYGLGVYAHGVVDGENSVDASVSFRERRNSGYGDYWVRTVGSALRYVNSAGWRGFENKFVSGGDFKFDMINASAQVRNNYERFTGELYARDEFFPFEDFSFSAGARAGAVMSHDKFCTASHCGRESGNEGVVSGEIGLNWRAGEHSKVFFRFSPFYHSPLADEMFSSYGACNMSLRSEKGISAESGFEWRIAEEIDFSFTLFASRLSDEIVYMNSGNVNLEDDTVRNGAEMGLCWSRRKVGSAGILYSFVESKFAEGVFDGNLVPMVPRQRLRLFAEMWFCEILSVYGGYRFVGEQRFGGDYAGRGGMLPAYGIFDLGIRLKPTGFLEGIVISAGVENLFDKRYCDYGEYFDPWYMYPASGRTFMVTLRYTF